MQSISIVIWRCVVSVCLSLFVLTEGHNVLRHMVDKLDPKLAETVGVELSAESKRNSSSRYRREAISSDQSDELNFDLRIADQPIHLVLRHNPNTELPVYVMRSGKAVQEDVPSLRTTRMYQDSAHQGSFAVTEPTGDSSGYMLEGVFTVNNDLYLISPNTDGGQMKRSESGYSHSVHTLESTVNIFADPILSDEEDVVVRRTSGRPKRGDTDYEIELFMVTDSSIYDFWYEKQTACTQDQKKLLAMNAIKQYYAFVINAMDLRFKNIKAADFSISILAAGLLIMQKPEESPWTDSIVVKNLHPGRATVNPYTALESFDEWVDGQEDLSQADDVMLFTGYDLANNGKNDIAGLARFATICTPKKTAIVETSFHFGVVTTAAHELGHNLGVQHDGPGNVCSSDDLYIMANTSSDSKPRHGNNAWNWSPCSIEYLRSTMESLNQGDNCLKHKSDKSHQTESSPLPGQVYSMDQQCAYSIGDGSSVCRIYYNETTYPLNCVGIFCSLPSGSCKKIFPAEGSSCGDKQWCINGRCVQDEKAPSLTPMCIYGDTPGTPFQRTKTCKEIIKDDPRQCYWDNVLRECCDSCPSIRTNIKGCEYGDKQDWCTSITRNNCYAGDNASYCCKTCKSFETGIQDCEFGDKAAGCALVPVNLCSAGNNKALCCEKCNSA